MPSAETARLVAELTLKDKMSAGLKTADRNLRAFDKSTANTQKSLSKFGNNIGKAFAVGAAATVAGGVLVVNAAADYEDAFAGVRKTVEASKEEFSALSQAFRDMAKTIPIPAAELARLGEAAGALGIEGTKNIEEFVRVTALLGQTTDLTADSAATSLGILTNLLGLTSEEYSAFASSLVALGNAGASTESQIIAIAENAGAAGELIGLTTDQVLGLSSAVASLGIDPEAGGSALQKFFIDTAKFVAEGGDELKTFAKISGTSAKQFKKNFEKDAGKALQQFLANLGKLSQGDQLAALESLGFNDVRITRTLLGLAGSTEEVGKQMEIANTAFKENTALSKEAAERNKTFASQLGITKNVLNDIAITIGTALLPKLTPLLQRFNDFASQNQGQIETVAQDIADAFEQVADSLGKVDWQPFIDGLKFSADVARGAIGAFQAMPDWLQKFIVAGAVANKVTGGLITSLGKDAIKIAFDQFAGKGSSPANPLWVQQVGGVGPGGSGPGGKGGGFTRLLTDLLAGAVGFGIATEVAREGGASVGPAEDVPGNLDRIMLGFKAVLNQGGLFDAWSPGDGNKINQHLGDVLEAQKATKVQNQQDAFAIKDAVNQSVTVTQQAAFAIRDAEVQSAAKNQQAAFQVRDAVNTKVGLLPPILQNVKNAADSTTRAAAEAGRKAAFAIRDKDLSVSVNNTINTNVAVSVRETIKTQTTHKQYQKFIQ